MGKYQLQVFAPTATVGRTLLEGFRNIWELGNEVGALAYMFRCRDGLVIAPELAENTLTCLPSMPWAGIRRCQADATGGWKSQDAPELPGYWFMTLPELARRITAYHYTGRTILCDISAYPNELRQALKLVDLPPERFIYGTAEQFTAGDAMRSGLQALWIRNATWWESHGFPCVSANPGILELPVGCGITVTLDYLLLLEEAGVRRLQEWYPLFVTAGNSSFTSERFATLRQWQVHAVICPDPVLALIP